MCVAVLGAIFLVNYTGDFINLVAQLHHNESWAYMQYVIPEVITKVGFT